MTIGDHELVDIPLNYAALYMRPVLIASVALAPVVIVRAEEPDPDSAVPAYSYFEPDSDYDQEQLLEMYIAHLARMESDPAGAQDPALAPRRSTLAKAALFAYDRIYEAAADIAAGRRDNSVIHIPLGEYFPTAGQRIEITELGLTENMTDDEINEAIGWDMDQTLRCLYADCPYEFYWCSKGSSYSTYPFKREYEDSVCYLVFMSDYELPLTVTAAYSSGAGESWSTSVDVQKKELLRKRWPMRQSMSGTRLPCRIMKS